MKFLILIVLLAFAANGSIIPEKKTQVNYLELMPKNICANVPSGTTFPVANNCNEFILCVNSMVTIGQCPPNSRYFDACTSTCSNSNFVCNRTWCYEETTFLPWDTTTTTTTRGPIETTTWN